MPLVLSLVLAGSGLASLGYGLFAGNKPSPQPPSPQPPSPQPPSPQPPSPQPSGETPPELMAAAQYLIANGKDPVAMEQVASVMDSLGYASIAYALRRRADELRSSKTVPNPMPQPPPVPDIPPPTPRPEAEATATILVTDLSLRSAPSTAAPRMALFSRPTIVKVLDWNAGTADGWLWAFVEMADGRRGFMAKANTVGTLKYLSLNAPAPSVSGEGDYELVRGPVDIGAEGPRQALCLAPSGCRLRRAPKAVSPFDGFVARGERVALLKQVKGAKAERTSPGPGGWSLVRAGELTGWVPSEWLVLEGERT